MNYKYILYIFLIIMLVGGVSAGEILQPSEDLESKDTSVQTNLKMGTTVTDKTSVNINANDVTFTDKATEVSVKTETKIDGVLFKPTTSKIDTGAIVFETDEADPVATFKYEYIGNRLKETIILKENKDLSFPITLTNGDKIMSWGNTWIINKDGSTTDGIIAEVPYGIDANGNRINMYYTYDGKNLNLQYNRMISVYNEELTKTRNLRDSYISNGSTISNLIPQYDHIGITYPLTIDPTWTTLSGNVNFASNKTTAYTYSPIQFNDTSTGSPTNWTWFFGDETYNNNFTLVNDSSGWNARYRPALSTLPNGCIILTGGLNSSVSYNDTWSSCDGGNKWNRIDVDYVWASRQGHSMVTTINGSLILFGGINTDGTGMDNTYISYNGGSNWYLINATNNMFKYLQRSVVLPDNSIVAMGGVNFASNVIYQTVYRSITNGSSWVLINTSAWNNGTRYGMGAVVNSYGDIIVIGGSNLSSTQNNVWISKDKGYTWILANQSFAFWGIGGTAQITSDNTIFFNTFGASNANYSYISKDNGYTWLAKPTTIPSQNYITSTILPNNSIITLFTIGFSEYPLLSNKTYMTNPSSSSIQNATKTYTTAGIYNVTLTAFNKSGYNSTMKNFYMTVKDSPMYTNFTGTPTTIQTGQLVQFNDTTTGNPPTSWQWTFGDLTTNTTSSSPLKTYTTTGIYTVSLTTTNSLMSNTSTRTNYITVTDGTPYAQFTSNTTTGLSPLSVQFNDTTNSSSTYWNWTFGASNFSNLQNPVYTFNGVGRYNVKLNVSTATTFNITNKLNYINATALLTNPLSTINLTSDTIYIGANDTIIMSVKNITASAIYANISFNKSEVTLMNVTTNFSVYPGLKVSSVISNTSGFVYMNISNNTGGNIYIGNTLTPIIDMNFKAISYSNRSAPLNYISANELLTNGGIEDIVYRNPSVITTTDGNFTFVANIINAATNSQVLTLATINATGSNVIPNSQQTETGSATLTSNYGDVIFEISAQGYYTLTQTKLVSSNAPLSFKLTPLSGSTLQTWYSPHQVSFKVIDMNGQSLKDTSIIVTVVESTLSGGISGAATTLMNTFGISQAAAATMVDQATNMQGTTDSNGQISFTMHGSLKYNILITTSTGSYLISVYPLEANYILRTTSSSLVTPSQLTNSYKNIANTSLTFSEPNNSYMTLGLDYYDISGATDYIIFAIKSKSNNTIMYTNNQSISGATRVLINQTYKNNRGEQWLWYYDAHRTV